MDTLLNLASDLGDISAEEERGADRLHASIFMPAVPSEEPPPRDAAAELASTEHLVNLLANLSDARESFAAAWDDASRSSRGEEPPPEPPAAEKRSDALARAARALRAFEAFVIARSAPKDDEKVGRLERENAVLKRAVAIQAQRLKSQADDIDRLSKKAEDQADALKRAETTNYSLSCHLRHSSPGALGDFNFRRPDIC